MYIDLLTTIKKIKTYKHITYLNKSHGICFQTEHNLIY